MIQDQLKIVIVQDERRKMACRLCKSKKLEEFLDLGFSPTEDSFLSKEDLSDPEVWFPLRVSTCLDCGFAQLSYVAPLEAKFGAKYIYDTGATPTGVKHYNQFAKDVADTLKIEKKDLVIDIGSNTGVLLQAFKDACGCKVLGVDPAPIVAKIANEKGIKTYVLPFGKESAEKIVKKEGKAKLITGTNVFAHIDDLHDVMNGVKKLLAKDGVFIFESPHFLNLIKKMEYDTIYAGHCSYISIKPLVKFFAKFEMEIFDIVETDIHGGSIRVFIGKKGSHKVSKIVKEIVVREVSAQIQEIEFLKEWAKKIYKNSKDLSELLWSLKLKGKRIVGIGAPAKGTTLLVFSQIGTGVLDYLTDANPLKLGKFSPGLHIPIKSDEEFMKDKVDYALILPWNFSKPIMEKLAEFKRKGGKFIIPVPYPKIVK